MSTETYQNVIIGSGEGGKYLAWHLAQSSQKTAVVERHWIGGSCPNTNCLPSKSEIWSAKVANLVYHASKFGSMAHPGPIDMTVVCKRKRQMVDGLIAMHLDRYAVTGTELILGQANLAGGNTIDVKLNEGGTRTLHGERIFLNLGTRPAIPAVPGLVDCAPLTNIEVLELDRVPEHLIVIGGGYVGLEFAQAYRRFGSRVTVLHQGTQLLERADPDIAAEIVRMFSTEGIDVVAPAKIVSVHGRQEAESQSTPRQSMERVRFLAAMSSLQLGGPQTLPESAWTLPASNWTSEATSRSTTAWRQLLRMCGRSANVLGAHNSRMLRSMIFA